MMNPLLQKYEELHKKPETKFIKAENVNIEFELKPEFLEQLANQPPITPITSITSNHTTLAVTATTGITKVTSYDKQSGDDAFLQIAEKVKNGTAQVSRVSIELDNYGNFSYGKKIMFEVYDYGP